MFPMTDSSLMWSRPPHVFHLGQGQVRAGLYRVTLCRGAERRPGLVARRGDIEVTPAVFQLPTDFPKDCANDPSNKLSARLGALFKMCRNSKRMCRVALNHWKSALGAPVFSDG